ncbi:ADP-ribosylglycohydrolase family protein [Pelagovum pacificum]|uniref:ADP-ribosylglycohydrolase family protein n=1 Tax=Pelagovum pacificum TaxID=2588711 RepID=A0A5C5GAN6_9RHOB|nr:ADP-ribosylglycohydrolase family protein [Pelagovum pacificum]QQA41759.1 ADP-ribosylglycohydrolase family protein [Pelagovum pacificum]TNY31032.1 ADP-ribosylglycohydrolase family protein [Pelagovum pacificum]
MPDIDLAARTRGALWGTACGDAFGMPNSFLKELPWLTEMKPGPENSPYHAGYAAGRITDDTEQAMALTEALLEGFSAESVARHLFDWFVSVGGKDSLAVGPSTMRAMLAFEAGTPLSELGKTGVTNGSAMRISPIGVFAALSGAGTAGFLDLVETACRPTHHTSPAISGSAAVAAAVKAAMEGAAWDDVVAASVEAAELGTERGNWIYCPDIGAKIEWACGLVADLDSEEAVADTVSRLVGTGEPCTESVPAALAFSHWAKGNPEIAIRIAANSRGDTDTTAAMAGAICGAYSGEDAIPAEWREIVGRTNDLDVEAWAKKLETAAG